jgi:hypothetical protein
MVIIGDQFKLQEKKAARKEEYLTHKPAMIEKAVNLAMGTGKELRKKIAPPAKVKVVPVVDPHYGSDYGEEHYGSDNENNNNDNSSRKKRKEEDGTLLNIGATSSHNHHNSPPNDQNSSFFGNDNSSYNSSDEEDGKYQPQPQPQPIKIKPKSKDIRHSSSEEIMDDFIKSVTTSKEVQRQQLRVRETEAVNEGKRLDLERDRLELDKERMRTQNEVTLLLLQQRKRA